MKQSYFTFILFLFTASINSMELNLKEQYEKDLEHYFCIPWPTASAVISLLKIPGGKETFIKLAQQKSLKSGFNPVDLLHNLIHIPGERLLAADVLSICLQTAKINGYPDFANTRYYNRTPGFHDTQGTSLLTDCVRANNIPCAQVLLNDGADANQWECNHRHSNVVLYPLQQAYRAYGKESAIYKLLEAHGASFLPCDEEKYNNLESDKQKV